MRLSRTAMALIVGVIFVATWIVLERYVVQGFLEGFVPPHRRLGASGLAALAVGLGLFWLADRFDIMAPSYTPTIVDLQADHDAADQPLEPIRPGRW